MHKAITAHPEPSTLISSHAVLATTTIKLDLVQPMTASIVDSTNIVQAMAYRQRPNVHLVHITPNLRQLHTAHLVLQAIRASKTAPSFTQYPARRASTLQRGQHIAHTARLADTVQMKARLT